MSLFHISSRELCFISKLAEDNERVKVPRVWVLVLRVRMHKALMYKDRLETYFKSHKALKFAYIMGNEQQMSKLAAVAKVCSYTTLWFNMRVI